MPPARRTTPARKQPQDHKPKATKVLAAEAAGAPFEFEHDGKTYVLPNAAPYAVAMTGGDFMDAILDGDDQVEMRLTLLAVRAAKPDIEPAAYEALRAKPLEEFASVVNEWLQAAGASVGESSGSSS